MDKNQKIALLVVSFGALFAFSKRAQASTANSSFDTTTTNFFDPFGIGSTLTNTVLDMTTGLTRGERNNNPGNLEGGGNWQGMTGTDGPYLVFSSPYWGLRALAIDLGSKFNRGLNTVRKIISVYAPPSDNNTAAYIAAVCQSLGVSADTPLDLNDPATRAAFVQAIIMHENGRVSYASADIQAGVNTAMGLA